MPPKKAKKGTSSQTQNAIAQTQSGVRQAIQQQLVRTNAETQVDADTQRDVDSQLMGQPESSNSNPVDDAMASTADGAPDLTPNTEVPSDDEAETKVAKKKPAADDAKKDDGDNKKRKKKRKQEPTNFAAYIFKVQKQVHPDCSMSKKAMQIMNDFIKDICIRIAELASDLCKKTKMATLRAHDIQTATKLILSGELAKHAQSEACKALRTFNKNTKQGLR